MALGISEMHEPPDRINQSGEIIPAKTVEIGDMVFPEKPEQKK